MRLWTIQSKCVYDDLVKKRTICAKEEYICDASFCLAYKWMAEQMQKRIGDAPSGIEYPVWAWYLLDGKRKRPDLRFYGRNWGEKGRELVLITFDAPDEAVLLSEFDYWNVVLGDSMNLQNFNAGSKPSEKLKKSWERIFDTTGCLNESESEIKYVQASLWEIKAEWIIKAEFFRSR